RGAADLLTDAAERTDHAHPVGRRRPRPRSGPRSGAPRRVLRRRSRHDVRRGRGTAVLQRFRCGLSRSGAAGRGRHGAGPPTRRRPPSATPPPPAGADGPRRGGRPRGGPRRGRRRLPGQTVQLRGTGGTVASAGPPVRRPRRRPHRRRTAPRPGGAPRLARRGGTGPDAARVLDAALFHAPSWTDGLGGGPARARLGRAGRPVHRIGAGHPEPSAAKTRRPRPDHDDHRRGLPTRGGAVIRAMRSLRARLTLAGSLAIYLPVLLLFVIT